MTVIRYSSWGGAIQRAIHTDPDDPYRFTTETTINLPDAFFDRNRALAEDQKGAAKLVARVPATIYEQSLIEGWDDAKWTQWLNDPDNRAFRVWPGRL